MICRSSFAAAVCLASAFAATPQLTTIEDVLYKADGTPFNGTLTINWTSFQSPDNVAIITQSTTVKVAGGILHVQLVPSPTDPPSYYTVVYNSDGRVQFQESWSVPSSSQSVRVSAVRVAAPTVASQTTGAGSTGPISESDVVGLVADLSARPLEGSAFTPGRVAYVNSLGSIDSVSGNGQDCLHVDGSSGTCGTANLAFVDGDSPGGIVDGSNVTFTLSGTPSPAASLALFRNGVLQKVGQDFSAAGNTVQFVAANVPQAGDTLLASYRLGGTSSSATPAYTAPQVLCTGNGLTIAGTSPASMGACAIPAGLLLAGDRVEIHFDLGHTGSASGFSFEVDWGATAMVNRSGSNTDALVSGRAEAAVLPAGAQLNSQSWGTGLPFSATVGTAPDAYAAGITVTFRGSLAQIGDHLTLAGYSVVRVP